MKISIIIPTLNEEKFLSYLLESIKNQNFEIHEIIVADGFSKDNTRKIAEKYGCKVIDGPDHPGTGRNIGAKEATGNILLFIDADIVLPENFLLDFFKVFNNKKLDCAACIYKPNPGRFIEKMSYYFGNAFMYLTQIISPLAAGYFIAIKKETFNQINGFDETLLLCEDHDLVKRAAKIGKFRVLWKTVWVSTRRYKKYSVIQLFTIYFITTVQTIFGIKIKKDNKYIKYDFGKHL